MGDRDGKLRLYTLSKTPSLPMSGAAAQKTRSCCLFVLHLMETDSFGLACLRDHEEAGWVHRRASDEGRLAGCNYEE